MNFLFIILPTLCILTSICINPSHPRVHNLCVGVIMEIENVKGIGSKIIIRIGENEPFALCCGHPVVAAATGMTFRGRVKENYLAWAFNFFSLDRFFAVVHNDYLDSFLIGDRIEEFGQELNGPAPYRNYN